MPKYRIDWKSTSGYAGTERTEYEGEDLYETKEDAEAAIAEFQKDENYMSDVHSAAVEGQGVEGWIEAVEADDD